MSDAFPSFPTQGAAPGARAGAAAPLSPQAELRRGVRYGISVAAVVLGVYLVMHWNPSALLFPGNPLAGAQAVLQLGIGLLVLVTGLAVAPTTVVRAVIASVLALGTVLLSAILLSLILTGTLPLRMPLLGMLLSPVTAALGSALLGWLIVRRRHPLTYVLVLGALLPGVARYALIWAGIDSQLLWFVDLPLVLIVGVGGAWIAAGISRLLAPRVSPSAS